MRASSLVVVLSSLLAAQVAAAGPSDKPEAKKPAAPAPTASTKAAPTKAAPAKASPTPAAPAPTVSEPAAPTAPVDLASINPADKPTAVRMRQLEQSTQALKERAWQLKARVQMLKEQVLGGGAGASALIAHSNDMGASFRLIKLIYALDGTQVFVRTDDAGESLYKAKAFDVFSGPIAPGNHSVAAIATYRGHGYGVFEYLSKYTFTAKGSQAFLAGEGKISKVDCKGFEKGGATTPLEKRPSIECKVVQVQPEKPAEKDAVGGPAAPATTAPATTPTAAPATTPTAAPATTPTAAPATTPTKPAAATPAATKPAPAATKPGK